ncbi:FAD dependent oxidoreductase [Heliocybe sulcata]|uniref:FAD dependent oxidoreductase n=1 Tax=Heliocybe sulcata TaxID=5364 RepID=A0A5C3MWK0_9AGAM|nr:FAD dependent oxidoreductase [Heliocybe sulcata]
MPGRLSLTFRTLCSLVAALSIASAQASSGPELFVRSADATSSACSQIEAALSSASELSLPGLGSFYQDIGHWATSSTQQAACSVQPGSTQDLGKIMQIIAATNSSFAVKGGGHTSNPGFSSTTGVHISMSRFSEVTYHAESSTVDVGSGLIWDDVYAALEPDNAMVVGGRVTGVGVAGFTLGGGYSWLTNQYGLTIDTVTGYELVLPNGTVASITDSSNPDLMFALRGGYNNFGVVTKFTLKAYPSANVWGGLITYTANTLDDVASASVNFSSKVTDPKAGIITTYNFVLGEIGVSQLLFYDAPQAPAGIFDEFLAISSFSKDVKSRTFSDLVRNIPSNATGGTRGIFNTVSLLEYTPELMEVIRNETQYWGQKLSLEDSGTFISYDVEPFQPTLFTHGSTSTASYPPTRSQGLLPLNLYWAYWDSSKDQVFYDAITQSAATIKAKAVELGQDVADAPVYGNYAIFSTPIDKIYGGNLERLRTIKQQYDPNNVMALAGGWKI